MSGIDILRSFQDQHPGFIKLSTSWFEDNWHLVVAFEHAALQLINKGRRHYSARAIVEVLAHNSILAEVDSKYKFGNDTAPDLARAFVVLHPQHVNFWEYRRKDTPEFRAAVMAWRFGF